MICVSAFKPFFSRDKTTYGQGYIAVAAVRVRFRHIFHHIEQSVESRIGFFVKFPYAGKTCGGTVGKMEGEKERKK